MNPESIVSVAGHLDMVGRAIVHHLLPYGVQPSQITTHAKLDLTNQATGQPFFAQSKPDQVYLICTYQFTSIGVIEKEVLNRHFCSARLLNIKNFYKKSRSCNAKR